MKKKLNIKAAIVILIFLISLIFAIMSAIKITIWFFENKQIDAVTNDINEVTEIIEAEDDENTEIITPTKEIPKSNPYWDYIKMNLINVNFEELKDINSSTVGWVQVNGTNINYPFVQTKDNSYYLKHSFDKSYNSAGWVFMDYRNNADNFSKNTILYAHGRTNQTMFGSLRNILSNDWLNDSNNYIIKVSTETENTLWQVFSVYHIPTTNDYIQVNFPTDEEFLELMNTLINRSAFDFNTTVDKDDKIITLSTCYSATEKLVLHAKLIKRNIRDN